MTEITPILRPPIQGLILIITAIILHYVIPIQQIILFPYTLFGTTLIVLGFALGMWGSTEFGRANTPVIPGSRAKKVVSSGPYTFTRNPMYLGLFLVILGTSILMGSLISFISPLLFLVIFNFFFIPWEERLMKKTQGKKYLNYKKKVRRWL